MANTSTARDLVPVGRAKRPAAPDPYRIDLALFLVASLTYTLFACHRQEAPAAAAAVAAPLPADARACAAAEVYTRATADDWLQRAAIAQATLNAQKLGMTPDCASWARPLLEGRRDPLRWLDALDAVDAVASGSYTLPPACARATVVAPLSTSQWPEAQCVVRDLVFAEVRL